jgi:trimeric autotransporter adhesin
LRSPFARFAPLLLLVSLPATAASTGLASFSLNPTDVAGGSSSTGTVTLDGAAPSGGFVVSLQSGSTYANVPASVTVPAGATSATFQITTHPVADPAPIVVPVGISASHPPVTKHQTLGVFPPSVKSLVLLPSTATGGTPLQGRVTLTSPAASSGSRVGLSSNDTAVTTVPSEVTVAGGTLVKDFPVTTIPVETLTSVTISAQRNPFNVKTATLAVAAPALYSLVCNPAKGGATSLCTVTLTGTAPWGAVVTVSSSNPAVVTVHATVTVHTKSANFFTTTKRVSSPVDVAISASYAGKTRTETVLVTPSGVEP